MFLLNLFNTILLYANDMTITLNSITNKIPKKVKIILKIINLQKTTIV